MTFEANIRISRSDSKHVTVDVSMPIWSKPSEHGHLVIKLPLIGIETIALDESDSDRAIEEAITSFCIAADRFGQGVEKELQALGWTQTDDNGVPVIGYTVADGPDSVIERLIGTGDNFVKRHLEIA